jgi:hypothetical protein
MDPVWPSHRSNTATILLTVSLIGITLSEIEGIKILGLGIITVADFVDKTEFNSLHACHNNPTEGIGTTDTDLSSIPDLKATDFKIQAHRGIWGTFNETKENKLAAMNKASDLSCLPDFI